LDLVCSLHWSPFSPNRHALTPLASRALARELPALSQGWAGTSGPADALQAGGAWWILRPR